MTLRKWKPFEDFMNLHNRIDRLFEEGLSRDYDKERGSFYSGYPVTDIYETIDSYVFRMEVPGLTKDDINIEFRENTLSISGERKEEKEVKEESYHRMESFCGTFSRSFTLPRNIDHQKIDANMTDGILELKIAKAEEAKAKSIPINVK